MNAKPDHEGLESDALDRPGGESWLGALVEGDLTRDEAAALAQRLAASPSEAIEARRMLMFADLLEQALVPERSAEAFLASLETRAAAEESGDAFVAALLPKLRAVDAEERLKVSKVVPFAPGVRFGGLRVRWPGAVAVAAALALVAVVTSLVLPLRPEGGAASVAVLRDTEDVVWETPAQEIEWEIGASLPPGVSIRLRSGKAKLEMQNGSVVTVAGPADLRLVSDSEGELLRGTVLANVAEGGTAFRLHTPNQVFEVDGGSVGIRTLDDERVGATLLSSVGRLMALAREGQAEQVPPGESVVAGADLDRVSRVAFDWDSYQDLLPLLSGVREVSSPVHLGAPGGVPQAVRANENGAILVVLEDGDIQSEIPLRVDLVPGAHLALSSAALGDDGAWPEISLKERVRSYLVQLDAIQGRPGGGAGDELVEAYVTFDQPILGVSASPSTLILSDEVVSESAMRSYLASLGNAPRGLASEEKVEIGGDGRTLAMRVRLSNRTQPGQLRVFVLAP